MSFIKDIIGDKDGEPLKKEPETLTVSLAGARRFFARLSQLVEDRFEYIDGKITRNELTAAETAVIMRDRAQWEDLRREIRLVLDNPKLEIDWDRLEEILILLGRLVSALR